ncbi:MAG: undecaprenyl-diphosphate phosphatase [Lentisphaeria bacterium]|nr:undecaprenyl-diphosphate phosphatase [Lentisphaeria bacterium]
MDPLFWKAFLQGIVQGLTEFLPISSTGHMILFDHFLAMGKPFSDLFEVVVQLGSILSVIVYFAKKIFPASLRKDDLKTWFMLWLKVGVAVIPALIVGALLGSLIQEKLYNAITVAVTLLLGGIFLIAADSAEKKGSVKQEIAELSWWRAFGIGCCQCIAMIPGVSRSAATIVGGMFFGCSRPLAAKFSFFLAIPTMMAASAYSLLKHGAKVSGTEWIALAIGFVTAFFVAWAVIAFFMKFIRKHDFKPFGYYRIVLAIIVFILFACKVI